MKKLIPILLIVLGILIILFFSGPTPPTPVYNKSLPSLPDDLSVVEKQITDREKTVKIKPDNEARFIWANDSLKGKTEFALLYLHGFSACWYEGSPVNTDFTRHFGCNAYFPRLASHGIDTTEALVNMTPDHLWESAKEALVVAGKLGNKVIIMSTSTGGTLSLKLAAEFPELISGLILFSPNIKINNSMAWVVTRPWGLQLARKIGGGEYRVTNSDSTAKECQYWNCKYRLEAVVYLQQLLESTMKEELFRKVQSPVFLGYYYKDEQHQDQTVRVDAALNMFDQLGTPAGMKVKQAFPEAGGHCIASGLYSGAVDDVRAASFSFAENVLGMKPVM